MSNVVEIGHPLVQHHLTKLRDRETSPVEFRASMRRLAALLVYEATSDLAVRNVTIHTPIATTNGVELSPQIGLVPILRAGLGMLDPILDLIPSAEVWHLGLYRDEVTATPVEYYCKIPQNRPVEVGMILDPMLATGGSASLAIEVLQRWGIGSIRLLSVIASSEGIDTVTRRFPNVRIFVGAIDDHLNANKYIVPGLGDAGDRFFNTLRPSL